VSGVTGRLESQGLRGRWRCEDRGHEVDEVAHEQPIVGVRRTVGAPRELDDREALGDEASMKAQRLTLRTRHEARNGGA
jgi:hypothetical protein